MIRRILSYLPTVACALLALTLLLLPALIPGRTLSAETLSGTRLLAVLLLLLAVPVALRRHSIAGFFVALWADGRTSCVQIGADLAAWWRTEARWHGLFLLALIVLGAFLRWTFIQQPIRTDEAVTYLNFATKPLYLALTDYAAPNNHLLHTLFVHLSTRLFGPPEWAIRLPAFIAGVLLIPATYYTVRRLTKRDAGLLAAAFVCTSSVLIEYSVNGRGYTLQTLLFVLAVATADYLRRQGQPRLSAWALLAVLSALAFYTIPTALYGVGGLYLWLLFGVWRDARKRLYAMLSALAGASLTLVLYLPVIIVSGLGAIIGNRYVAPLDFAEFAAQLSPALLATLTQWHYGILWPLLMLGFITALIWQRRNLGHYLTLLFFIVLWSGLVLLVQRAVPFTRVWLFLLPLYMGLASAGLVLAAQQVMQGRLRVFVPLLALGVTVFGALWIWWTVAPLRSLETGTFRNAEQVTLLLDGARQPGETIVYEHPSGDSLRYYWHLYGLDWDEALFYASSQMLVVVNNEYAQDVDTVLRNNGIRDPSVFGQRDLVAEFFRAEVYRVTR